MYCKTFTAKELMSFSRSLESTIDSEKRVYHEGLRFKKRLEDGEYEGIHYWDGYGYGRSELRTYIAVLDDSISEETQNWGDFDVDGSGYPSSVQYTSVTQPVLGLIVLQPDPHDSNKLQMSFIETHTNYRGRGIASMLIKELVNEMKRNGKHLHRSRVSQRAPSWLKPKIDQALNAANISWDQEPGYI